MSRGVYIATLAAHSGRIAASPATTTARSTERRVSRENFTSEADQPPGGYSGRMARISGKHLTCFRRMELADCFHTPWAVTTGNFARDGPACFLLMATNGLTLDCPVRSIRILLCKRIR